MKEIGTALSGEGRPPCRPPSLKQNHSDAADQTELVPPLVADSELKLSGIKPDPPRNAPLYRGSGFTPDMENQPNAYRVSVVKMLMKS